MVGRAAPAGNAAVPRAPGWGAMSAFGSYPPEEVTFLVKDLSDVVLEMPTEEFEARINRGQHYAELLPVEERQPPAEALALFQRALARSARRLAVAVGVATEAVLARHRRAPTLVSLSQTGTPIGILLRRWAAWRHGLALGHYTISIIRGRGTDANALRHIRERHGDASLQFVDGWTGKGAIAWELAAALGRPPLRPAAGSPEGLAVLTDPGDCALVAGTRDDLLIPSACLNATVCGLVSRTVLIPGLIGPDDFHGAKYYPELAREDRSLRFLDAITAEFPAVGAEVDARRAGLDGGERVPSWAGWRHARQLAAEYQLDDVNLVKAGISETVRMLLYRVASRVLIRPGPEEDLDDVLLLAANHGVPVEERADLRYASVGLMRPPPRT
jgi:Phosphoribosyl transferase (PRTase)/PELOTA RNA binding domain